MSLKKKILAGVLSGVVIFTGGFAFSGVEAADNDNRQISRERPPMERPPVEENDDYLNDNQRSDQQRDRERPPVERPSVEENDGYSNNKQRQGRGERPNKNDNRADNSQRSERERPQMSAEQMSEHAKKIADRYGVNQSEVLSAMQGDNHFGDIKHAAMLSKLSGKSFKDVLSMKSDWKQVAEKLGVSREQIDTLMKEEMTDDLAQRSKLDKKVVNDLLKDNYDPRDICMAGLIANESGKNVKTIIGKRKVNNSWEDVAKEYNVDFSKFREQNRPPHDERGDRD